MKKFTILLLMVLGIIIGSCEQSDPWVGWWGDCHTGMQNQDRDYANFVCALEGFANTVAYPWQHF